MNTEINLPKMIRVRQQFETPVLEDISQEIFSQIDRLKLSSKIKKKQSVAIGCSSRGIANYAEIVKATVQKLQVLGLKPFLFPAMGSHGSASSEGQKKVLENYGISEKKMGVPIKSSLDVIQIGETGDRIPVYIDKLAMKADHIVLINRIKMHTEFDADIESGLMKMMAIGLGKKIGATRYHQAIMEIGYYHTIRTIAHCVLETGKILFGVGIVENGLSQTAKIGVLPPETLEEDEKELLKVAKKLFARLPFEDVDVLIIDEMGKDISGTGFDSKVVGRIHMPLIAKEPASPRIKRIVVCDLTEKTEGNADGVGLADFVTKRLVDKIDFNALYVNAIAGAEPEHAKIPLTLKNDRDAVKVAIGSIGLIPIEKLKIIHIKNTSRLCEVDVSEAYISEFSDRADLEKISELRPIAFDSDGNLTR
ncbi:MAG: lactate racemase domain-containing protein [Desulfobacterales bacterium]|nr:lactate racemase domain-containing protein [Desulfobacterales bacterium]